MILISDLKKKISDVDKKISDTSAFVKKKTDYSPNITEIVNKINSTSGLATNSALAAVENQILNVSGLVKKTDYNLKISEIKKKITDHIYEKYIITPEFNNLTPENCKARLKQADLLKQRKNLTVNLKILVKEFLQII